MVDVLERSAAGDDSLPVGGRRIKCFLRAVLGMVVCWVIADSFFILHTGWRLQRYGGDYGDHLPFYHHPVAGEVTSLLPFGTVVMNTTGFPFASS